MKLPAFQFYPADWRKDPGVQSLDYHDRGIWMEMLCIMHESQQRGVLLLNGSPIPDDALARMLGLDKQILTTTITTLLSRGVMKQRDTDGALYSKRMVEDEKIIQIRRNAGKLGGNPVLLKQKPTTMVKQKPTPSSSSSSSSSDTPIVPKGDGIGDSDSEPKKKPDWQPDEQQRRVNSWFNRRDSTVWSDKERKSWLKNAAATNAEDFDALEKHYTAKPSRPYLRQDIYTLLNNWQGEIDRAKNYNPNNNGTHINTHRTDPANIPGRYTN